MNYGVSGVRNVDALVMTRRIEYDELDKFLEPNESVLSQLTALPVD